MVDMLIKIIADNTDMESEPKLTFMDYYNKKKGPKGLTFEEAKVLVVSYARSTFFYSELTTHKSLNGLRRSLMARIMRPFS